MSFIFILSNSGSKLQQCELRFDEQPGFTLLTRSIVDKKHIRTSIENSPFLSKDEKERLLEDIDADIPLWLKKNEIKQYCMIYLSTNMECPPNCERFITEIPAHAQHFHESDHVHDLREDNILNALWKISLENHALIDAAIGSEKTLRYSIHNYQPGQKLPKNAIPLMNYPEEVRRKTGQDYQSQKYWKLVGQIPEAAVKLPFVLLFSTMAAIARNPWTSVPFILAACFGIAEAWQANPAHAQQADAPGYPIGPATAHPAYFEALNQQHAAEGYISALQQPVQKTRTFYPTQDELVMAVRSDMLKANHRYFHLLMVYLRGDQDKRANILVKGEKVIDLRDGAPDGTSVLSYITRQKIEPAEKFKLTDKLIKLGAPIHVQDRVSNPLFIAASNNELELVKHYLQYGCKTIIRTGNLLAEAITAEADNVVDYLLKNNLVDVNQEILFENPVPIPEKAKQVPVLAAILKNKFERITAMINQAKLTIKTLEFYFDDLFLVTFSFPDRVSALQLTSLLHDGSNAIFNKWEACIKKYEDKLPMGKARRFIQDFREKDTRFKLNFQRETVNQKIEILLELFRTGSVSYVKNLLEVSHIHINDLLGKKPLISHIVDNEKISSSEKIAICATLIDWGAEINKNRLSNPLLRAVRQDDLELVLFLVGKGGKLVLPNHHALYWAIASNAQKVMDHLLIKVFDINEIINKEPITRTPILALAKSNNPHIVEQLGEYGLGPKVLLHSLDVLVDSLLDSTDAKSMFHACARILEQRPEWLNQRLIRLIREAKFSDPAKELQFQNLMQHYIDSLHTRMQCSLSQNVCSISEIVGESLLRVILKWALLMRVNPTLSIIYILTVLFIIISLTIIYYSRSAHPKLRLAIEKLITENQQVIEETFVTSTENTSQILSMQAAMLTIYRYVGDLIDLPCPTEEVALRAMLKNQRTTMLRLNDEEKKLYKRITITEEARKIVTEKLCGFLKETPKDPVEQGKLLRKDIIVRSPEYRNITANNLLVGKIDTYLELVKGHKKSNFEGAFGEIKQKNSTFPILPSQENILKELTLREERIQAHQQSLNQFKYDLQTLKETIQQNKEDKHDDASLKSIHDSLNNLIDERERIDAWCKKQGVTVGKIKIKTSSLEGKKPVTKHPRSSVPSPIQTAPINPATAGRIPQIPRIPEVLLSREINYNRKKETGFFESKATPVIRDDRIFYIVHLMQLMENAKGETDPVLQRDEARQLLSKCSDFIYTFCHHHEEIHGVFTWWNDMWVLRNAILHNTVLWNQHNPVVLLEEFLQTFEKPFYKLMHTGLCSKAIETNKLKNLYLFMDKPKEKIPDYMETIQGLESLCLKMNSYYIMASEAKAKQRFEYDGLLHAAMLCCLLEMRDVFRDLNKFKNNKDYSGPQYDNQKRQCKKLCTIIYNIKIAHGKSLLELANIAAHETNDFKNRAVGREVANSYQFICEEKTYYVQEPVPYLKIFDLFHAFHKEGLHKKPSPVSSMLDIMNSNKLLRKPGLPADMSLTFVKAEFLNK